jgi:O-antigen/teichoic acid export membrane protein
MRLQAIGGCLPGANGLARGSVTAFVVHAAGVGLTYLSQLALVRLMGTASYGVYAYVLGIMTLLAYLAALGFDVSLLRFIPAYRSQQAWGLVRGVIRYAERHSIMVGMAIAITGGLAAAAWHDESRPGPARTFVIGFGLVPVYALLWIRSAEVRAFGGVASALLPDRVMRDGLLLAATLLGSLLPRGQVGPPAAMMVTLGAAVAGLTLSSVMARLSVLRIVATATSEQAVATWRRTVFPLVTIAMAEVAMNRTGTLALAWAGRPSDAGIYALAFSLTAIVILPRIAINTQFAPMVADHLARGDRFGLQRLLNQATLWTALGATGIGCTLLVVARPLLLRWLGADGLAGLPVLAVLLAGQVVASGVGSQLFLLTMSGHEGLAAAVMAAAAGTSLGVSVLVVPYYGLLGTSVVTSAALVGMNAGMALLVWRRLGLLPGFVGFLPPWGGITGLARNAGTGSGSGGDSW